MNQLLAYAMDMVLTDPASVDLDLDACVAHAKNYFGESFEKTVGLA